MEQTERLNRLIASPQILQKEDERLIREALDKYPFSTPLISLLLIWTKKFNSSMLDFLIEKYQYHYPEGKKSIQELLTKFSGISIPTSITKSSSSVKSTEELKQKILSVKTAPIDEIKSKLTIQEPISYEESLRKLGLEHLKDPFAEIKKSVEKNFEVNRQEEKSEQKKDETNSPQVSVEKSTEASETATPSLQIIQAIENAQQKSVSAENPILDALMAVKKKVTVESRPISTSSFHQKLPVIEKFIEENPSISPIKETEEKDDFYKKLLNKGQKNKSFEHPVTETLAQLYIEQNKWDKAIMAYEELRLKFPEKSSYFADQIQKIQQLKNSN